MPTDAVILVESLKKDGNIPEYLIFVRGDKFEDSWSLAKALEEFRGKNTGGFEISYYNGFTPEEFETRFTNKLSRVNVLFARSPKELDALRKKFNVLSAEALPEELLETDRVEPKNSQRVLPQTIEAGNFHFMPEREYESENNRKLGSALFNAVLIICLIITAIIGIIWLPLYYAYKGICCLIRKFAKKSDILKKRQGT